jgi:hypothetical protein
VIGLEIEVREGQKGGEVYMIVQYLYWKME